jgi:outer membrane protein assembly factor BamB
VVASQDGGFFGVTAYSKDVPAGFLAAKRFELYSADGNRLFQIDNPGVSEFYISDRAELIVGISASDQTPRSGLAFFDRAGELLSRTTVEFINGVLFSADGKCFLVNSAKDGLISFDRSGQLKGSFGACDRFAVSSDGDRVAVVLEGRLKLYHQGQPAGDSAEIDSPPRAMSFSPGNDYLAVVDKKRLYLFEVATGELLWKHTLDRPELSFVSVDVSSGGERVVAGVDFDSGREAGRHRRHVKGLVYVLDKKGKIIWQREFTYRLWSSLFPRVRLSADGVKFSVTTRERSYLFDAGRLDK